MSKKKPLRVCVIAFPYLGGSVPLHSANCFKILERVSSKLYIITAGPVKYKPEKAIMEDLKVTLHGRDSIYPMWLSIPLQILKLTIIQIKMTIKLLKISRHIDIVFFTGAQSFLFPLLAAKVLRKKTVMVKGGSSSKSFKANHPNMTILYYISKIIENIHHVLLDQIIIQSKSTIHFLELEKFRKKVSICSVSYIDTDIFKIKKNLEERENLIGYIGGFSSGKGVLNFVKAIPLILQEKSELNFLIAGDGILFSQIEDELRVYNLSYKVKLNRWISHEEIHDSLNQLKLLVLPSYSEGIPVIVQEAMACGAIVLATPVGGIPDMIKNGETGFILKNNTPESIAKAVVNLLQRTDLEIVSRKAQKLVETEYTLETVVKSCGESLMELVS